MLEIQKRIKPDVLLYGIGIAALWYLFRQYLGIMNDADIYIGRALADLHPSSIGQQLSYIHDGQSRFSVFPALSVILVKYLGPGTAAVFLALSGLAVWLASAGFLLSRLVSGRWLVAALLCLCVMPPDYGGDWVFHWAEPLATPRIFSEAACLAAIAMLLVSRHVWALGFLMVAFLLHPIMALPAIAIAYIYFWGANKHWLWAGPAIAILVVLAGVAGIPVADRLAIFPDPTWREIIGKQSSQVLVSDWYIPGWSLTACQLVTVGLCWHLVHGEIRRLASAILIVAVAGAVLSMGHPPLLILQAQTWRALWLLSMFAAAFMPVVAGELWKKGPAGRSVLAMLFTAWIGVMNPLWAALALAAVAGLSIKPVSQAITRTTELCFWAVAVCAISYRLVVATDMIISWNSLIPYSASKELPYSYLGSGANQLPTLIGLSIALIAQWRPQTKAWVKPAAWTGIVLLAAMALAYWDRRSDFVQEIEQGAAASQLAVQMPSGEVFWWGNYIGDLSDTINHSWLITGRPSWWNPNQGAGVVFDRALAVESDHRYQLLVNAGFFAKPEQQSGATLRPSPPAISAKILNGLCIPGGPDWVVAPSQLVTSDARGREAALWQAPAPAYIWDLSRERLITVTQYAAFDCSAAKNRSPA